jgi:hypothetical protein
VVAVDAVCGRLRKGGGGGVVAVDAVRGKVPGIGGRGSGELADHGIGTGLGDEEGTDELVSVSSYCSL